MRQNKLVVSALVNDLPALYSCKLVVVAVNNELPNFESFEAVIVALNNQIIKFAACTSLLNVDVVVMTIYG